MKRKKAYSIGAAVFPLLGLLVWKLFFPQITGLDGVFLFMLGAFCLWSAAACPLGLLAPESSSGFRWAYCGFFLAFFALQVIQAFTDFSYYTLACIFLLAVLYLIQQLERKHQDS